MATNYQQTKLKEQPYSELDIPRIIHGEQRSEIRVIRLPQTIELHTFERRDIERVRISGRKPGWHRNTVKARRDRACWQPAVDGEVLNSDQVRVGRSGRVRFAVKGRPRVVFGQSDRRFSGQGSEAERRVAGIVKSEHRLIEGVQQIDTELIRVSLRRR